MTIDSLLFVQEKLRGNVHMNYYRHLPIRDGSATIYRNVHRVKTSDEYFAKYHGNYMHVKIIKPRYGAVYGRL